VSRRGIAATELADSTTDNDSLSLPFNPSRCSEDRLRPFVRRTDLGSERTPRVDSRVPCGVSDARRKKTEANRADRPTGALRVAGTPAGRTVLRRLARVPMMQASDHGCLNDPALVEALHRSRVRGVLVQREVCSGAVIVDEVLAQQAT
jgi:hypothetical protein